MEHAFTGRRGDYLALQTCGLVWAARWELLVSQDTHPHPVWDGGVEATATKMITAKPPELGNHQPHQ